MRHQGIRKNQLAIYKEIGIFNRAVGSDYDASSSDLFMEPQRIVILTITELGVVLRVFGQTAPVGLGLSELSKLPDAIDKALNGRATLYQSKNIRLLITIQKGQRSGGQILAVIPLDYYRDASTGNQICRPFPGRAFVHPDLWSNNNTLQGLGAALDGFARLAKAGQQEDVFNQCIAYINPANNPAKDENNTKKLVYWRENYGLGMLARTGKEVASAGRGLLARVSGSKSASSDSAVPVSATLGRTRSAVDIPGPLERSRSAMLPSVS